VAEPVADCAPPGHRGTRAVQRLVEYAPSTGGLALWVAHQDLPEPLSPTETMPPLVSTDGRTIRYSAAFERLPVPEQAGWVAHQLLHIALRHPARFLDLRRLTGDADLQLFNQCADAIVNSALAHLGWLELPPHAPTLERLLAAALGIDQAAEVALLEWDVERLYREIDDRRPAGGRQRNAASRSAGGEGDRNSTSPTAGATPADRLADGPRAARVRAFANPLHADLQPDPTTAGPPEAQAEASREWSERLQRAHANDGDFSMLRTLLADLPRSRTPWEQVLRTLLARALSLKRGVSWSRPSRSYLANQGRSASGRRLPWEPGFSATTSVPRLVLIIDVSGSIPDALMARFSREIEAIVRRLESSVVLVIGDDCVRHVHHFEPGRFTLQGLRFDGGGGTDFDPLLAEAGRHAPDIAVVLTDLDGPALQRPRWPVVWAVPEAFCAAVPPFGRMLVLR
jgi:predicted metal-dependent peptidase